MNIQDNNFEIFQGLYISLVQTRNWSHNAYHKILAAQRYYYLTNSGIDFLEEQEGVLTTLDEALVKFYWGNLALEQLWGVHDYLENPSQPLPDFHDAQIAGGLEEVIFLFAYLFDQALHTWRSYLDYYLKYLLYFLTGERTVNISIGVFRKKTEQYLTHTIDQRCQEVFDYIRMNVLCKTFDGDKECWGDLLRSLRDKTTHHTLIKPKLRPKENSRGYIVTWPTIRGKNYNDFVQQEFGNNAFEMMRELFPILYGFEWIPGPYRSGMYESR